MTRDQQLHFIKHLRQRVMTDSNERKRGLLTIILALAAGEFVNQMQSDFIGQYWDCPLHEENPQTFIQEAVDAFYDNPGLSGLTPHEIHVNEGQHYLFPSEVEVDVPDGKLRLPVAPNIATQADHIWVCCPKPGREGEILEGDEG